MKADCDLFSHLYIASKFHDGDIDNFFCHENHPWSPSLSEYGRLRLPMKKSDLLSCLCTGSTVESPSSLHAKIFDGPAIIYTLTNKQGKTSDEYGDQVFLPWINQQLQNCNRIDIVWDRYIVDSLKECTREKR